MSRSYRRRISLRLVFAVLSVLVWLILGILMSWIASLLLSDRMLDNAIVYGAILGMVMGMFLTGLALIVAWNTYSRRVMLWMMGGSGIGAIVGFLIFVSLVKAINHANFILPSGVGISAISGSLIGMGVWRSR